MFLHYLCQANTGKEEHKSNVRVLQRSQGLRAQPLRHVLNLFARILNFTPNFTQVFPEFFGLFLRQNLANPMTMVPLSDRLLAYAANFSADVLPVPLLPGNWEHSDG